MCNPEDHLRYIGVTMPDPGVGYEMGSMFSECFADGCLFEGAIYERGAATGYLMLSVKVDEEYLSPSR